MPHPGILIIHLHAHLPYVRHPEHDKFLEEDWLFEAMSETYIPILASLIRLREEGIRFRLSLTLSPPLCEMFADELLMNRYRARLGHLIELGQQEILRTRSSPEMNKVAIFHLNFFQEVAEFFDKCSGRMLPLFKTLQDSGHLEILTCGATHGFLPLVHTTNGVRAQLRVARKNYQKHFGKPPRGIWLPECAYYDGLDRLLAQEGYSYSFLEAHGLLFGQPCPTRGIWGPIVSRHGVHFLGRDVESSKQVWSAKEGYPGEGSYREFYRDLGYDGDEATVRPYMHGGGVRHNLGYKYFRITGSKVDLSEKKIYDPDAAAQTAKSHAGNFHFNRSGQFDHLNSIIGTTPVVLAPYDAELFGHWWFEGPWFLEHFMRMCAKHTDHFVLGTAPEAIEICGAEPCEPSPSSWGDGGYYNVWLNESNQWMYPHLAEAEEIMISAASAQHSDAGHMRVVKQMARELLLAQSSDWAFIASTGTTVPYAVRRFRLHIDNFQRLRRMLADNSINESELSSIESRDSIFAEMDPTVYRES
ncbi:MAG: 1,4-alpha-glucan branching protein domain-containing protein [Candidatus Brocadiia bacterium]